MQQIRAIPGLKKIYCLLGILLAFSLPGTALMAQEVSTLVPSISASGGLSVGPDGNIYVADFGDFLSGANGTTVFRITPEGNVSQFATGFQGASGNTFDANGNLIQANIAGNRIDSVSPGGVVTTIASTGLNSPVGVAIDSSGTIFVANCGGNSISSIQNGAGTTFAIGAPLSCPNGLTIDSDDNLYTANFNNGNIVRISPAGQMNVLATTPGSTFRPSGGNGHITFANNRLYVVSNASAQVFELTLDGTLTVLAGDGSRGHNNGPAAQASFSSPNGIDLSADGQTIYLNEALSTQGTTLNFQTFPLNPSLVRVIQLEPEEEVFPINPGLNGAWFEPATAGQGFFVDVIASQNQLFAGWFAYETDQGIVLGEGENAHRWAVVQGPYEDGVATLDVFLTEGGLFDDPAPVTTTAYGTATLAFSSCTSATFEYTLDSGLNGQIDLIRLTPDVFCTDLTTASTTQQTSGE